MWTIIFAHEWRLFWRSPLLVGGLGFLLLTGAYALYTGYIFVQEQRATLDRIDVGNHDRLARHLARYHADTLTDAGKRDYRWAHDAVITDRELEKIVYQPLSPLTGLSIGQRDVYPYYYATVPWDNVYQPASTEIRNPDTLLAGHFDLTFVLLYLVPLFIIVFGHTVLSEEQEQHTYALLIVQAGSIRTVVGYKLLFRLGLTLLPVWVLSVAGFVLNQVPINQLPQMLGWLGIDLLYTGFWFAGVYVVAARHRSSATNALVLVGTWVVVLLLIPSVLNYTLIQRQTDLESWQLVSIGRDKKVDPWYWPLPRLAQAFYRLAPQFSNPAYVVRDTSEFRFIAYTELNHHRLNRVGAARTKQQTQLYEQAVAVNVFNPSFTALNAYNQLAQSEQNHHLAFVQAVRAYQQQRRYFSFAYDLSGRPFGRAELNQFPEFRYQPPPTSLLTVAKCSWSLLVWVVGLTVFGYRRLAQVR